MTASSAFPDRIDVNHDVLHIRKIPLDIPMNVLGDGVGVDQGNIPPDRDFQIHICLIAELPGVQQVDLYHTLL